MTRGGDYDARWDEMAATGANLHGEADLVQSLLAHTGGRRVLDAGCGTGRIAIELARRGMSVTGVDADQEMLSVAQEKSPGLAWARCDLADAGHLQAVAAGPFDLVLLAGNVMIFLAPGTEQQVLVNLSQPLVPGGLLVAGFSLNTDLNVTRYDAMAAAAGLHPLHRWSTWDRDPFPDDGATDDGYADNGYVVSVHRR